MTLTPCRECGQKISSSAFSCPQCGAPRPAQPEYSGTGREWRSRRTIYGYPLVHIAYGRDQHGKLRVAKGVIAIGQFGIGIITIAQFGLGIIFGFGQFILGLVVIAQFAGGLLFGLGQFASGYIAIGQLVFGFFGLAQLGWGNHLWTSGAADPEAVRFFRELWQMVKAVFGG